LIWGGELRIISTHNGDDNPFNELVKDVRAQKVPYALHRVTFDEALAEGLYRRVCAKLNQDWTAEGEATWRKEIRAFYGADAEEELDCVPKNSAGAWLSRNLIEARMIEAPVLRWQPPQGFEVWPDRQRTAECADWIKAHLEPLLRALEPGLQSGFGEDFGRTGDLTVFAPWQITRTLKRRFPFLIELRNTPFQQQEQILVALCDALPRFISGALDARGNGQYLAERAMQRYGAQRIEQVMLSEPWYREHTGPMKAAFEDGTIEIPRDADVLADLRAFQVVRGVPRIPDRSVGTDGSKRHGDAGIAILLGDYASRREVVPMEFHALGQIRQTVGITDFMG
jgi:phage FluMu gp28-like protein